jgi:hypothetical protein
MNQLFREAPAHHEPLFATAPYRDDIGAFEGAYYAADGFYRPALNCLMLTRHPTFCVVCREAIQAMIDLYAGAGPVSSGSNNSLE